MSIINDGDYFHKKAKNLFYSVITIFIGGTKHVNLNDRLSTFGLITTCLSNYFFCCTHLSLNITDM